MKVAVLSDTHIPSALPALPETLLKQLRGVDRILHTGDLTTASVLDELEAIAPTTAILGNVDPPIMNRRLKEKEVLHLAGRTLGLAHGHQRHALQDQYIAFDYDDAAFDLFYQAMVAQLPGAEIIPVSYTHLRAHET